jgi:hypothetical protein
LQDKAWGKISVFEKIRNMNSCECGAKFDVIGYVDSTHMLT